ncbi:hypothetical protein UK23_18840 [Lentzea aerocolonigenes]|uniref:Uncharacterized protein n=1 Tax=Lentzea aerocolonigenes TaxID=68170 RepID=A0A0F0H2J3_LENAE|nr:hypothetical protein [Lentzea aerocolonigenes]KJK47878.1 hypothetical protein UK23_18840 [Lentzea aerocolonigenes]
MAINRWARRAVLTATALAFALPFTTGTAQADPIIEILGDNNVNVTVGAYNNNVDSIPISLGAGASLNTGSGLTLDLDENEGIQLALDIGHADIWAGASVGVPFTHIGVEASAAAAVDMPAAHVAVAPPPAAEPEVAAPPAPQVAALPAEPEAAPVLESAVTITDDTAAVTDEPKGDDEEEDCPDEAGPSGCPNITALGILSVCLLPNLVQLHI